MRPFAHRSLVLLLLLLAVWLVSIDTSQYFVLVLCNEKQQSPNFDEKSSFPATKACQKRRYHASIGAAYLQNGLEVEICLNK